MGKEEEVQLFYLFAESQRNPSKDPILLWFVGGPGYSALSAFLFEKCNAFPILNELIKIYRLI